MEQELRKKMVEEKETTEIKDARIHFGGINESLWYQNGYR